MGYHRYNMRDTEVPDEWGVWTVVGVTCYSGMYDRPTSLDYV